MATGPQAQRAADLHADQLSAYPNVVGIGTRPLDSRRSPADDDAHAVAVYVSQKVPDEQLSPDDRLPEHVEIRDAGGITQVPVVVVATGTFEPETDHTTARDQGFTTD